MPTYVWKDERTGATVEVDRPLAEWQRPPDEPGDWQRVFIVGTIIADGTTPARGSSTYGRRSYTTDRSTTSPDD